MRSQIFIMDTFSSMLIFLGILLFINFVWNSNLMEFQRQNKEMTYLRAEQTLDLVLSQLGSGHKLDESKVIQFVNQTNYNYSAVKESLGVWDLNFKFLIYDWNNNLLYNTSEMPKEEDILVTRRAMYMGQPVKISFWVWE